MLELEHVSHACPSGRSALYRATLSLPSLLLWLAAVLSMLSPAPCASAQAPRQKDIATQFIASQLLTESRVPSLAQQEN